MGHWRKNHESDSNSLRSSDLYDERGSEKAGRPVYFKPVVVIERMSVAKVKSREKPSGESRNFAHFKGHKKALGLNVTNAEAITMLAGSPDTARWIGLKLRLYVDPLAQYPGGKKGPAIRISTEAVGNAPVDKPPPELTPDTRERLETEHAERLGEREPGEEG
jgi:hypothetical protein